MNKICIGCGSRFRALAGEKCGDCIVSQVREIGKLEKDWDGYDSDPIAPITVEKALDVAGWIVDNGFLRCCGHVAPGSDGTIKFEFDDLETKYGVEVYVDKFAQLSAMTFIDGPFIDFDELVIDDYDKLRPILRKAMSE